MTTSVDNPPIVHIVDDDAGVCQALELLLTSNDYHCRSYPDAASFLNHYNNGPGCILLDVRMPGISGLELQDMLHQRDIHLPVIIITGHGDVAMAVRAMKAGAIDFIEKPFSARTLLGQIEQALQQGQQTHQRLAQQQQIDRQMQLLSRREQQVLDHILAGRINKVIAAELGISLSTVEAHRKRIMEKLQADSPSQLIRITLSYRQRHNPDPAAD